MININWLCIGILMGLLMSYFAPVDKWWPLGLGIIILIIFDVVIEKKKGGRK